MTSRALREAFHREYMSFFERAERTRRWSVFEDVPWHRLGECPADKELALCAETFCGVEMYLPDYLRAHLSLLAGDYGRAWFAANWGYEEAKHSLVLREYLRRSGQRTEAELHDYAEQVFARPWRAPYDDARQMTVYAALQELTTFVTYSKQRAAAQRAGDAVLSEVYRLIGRDEMAHSRFYQRMLILHLDDDRAGTLADLAHVLRTFRMPAEDLLPGYADRIVAMRAAGVDAGVFFTMVVLPLLEAVGVTRGEVFAVPAQTAVPARSGAM
jgi:acyl-[acyl-carrier-protein] desaturase